jgi:hypothetical protein
VSILLGPINGLTKKPLKVLLGGIPSEKKIILSLGANELH